MNYNKTSISSSNRLNISFQGINKSKQFANCPLTPSHLLLYKQFFNFIFQNYHEDNDAHHQLLIAQLKEIMEEVNRQGSSIKSVIKKVAVIHGFLYNAARKNFKGNFIVHRLEEQLDGAIIQLSRFGQPTKKRESSISKIYNYIRDITTSKEKRNMNDKSSNLQDHNDKQSTTQIIKKIIKPYAFQMQKIIQSYQAYASLVKNDHEEETPFYWKMANWSRTLGDILKQLVRIGRYFKDDFLGVEVLLVYLISIDLTMYYDILQAEIEHRGNPIMGSPPKRRIQQGQPQKQRQYVEVKELIEESFLIKQSLNLIFCTTSLKEWRKMFARSQHYKYEQTKGNQNEQLLTVIQHKQKQMRKHSKDNIRRSANEQQSYSLANPSRQIKQELQNKIKDYEFTMLNGLTGLTKNETMVRQNETISKLITRKEYPHLQAEKGSFDFIHEQSPIQHLNLLAKTNKIENIRKMRLMHVNDRQAKQKNMAATQKRK